MKLRSILYGLLCMLALGTMTVSCSDDDDDDATDDGSKVEMPRVRAFILNEGSMGSNNAGLAFYAPNGDAAFVSDIYRTQNGVGLGDTGQSMIEDDDYIYIAVYGSNRLVKLNAAGVQEASASFSGDTDLQGGIRYIVEEDGYIYASFYGGVMAKINARTLAVEAKLTGLGGNLEAVAECNGVLYVANSCAPDWSAYYNEVKTIDLRTFTLTGTVTVAENPYNQMLEEDDKVFLISNDYNSWEGYVLQMIDPARGNQVTKIGNASLIAADDDILYAINSVTDWSNYPDISVVNTFYTYNIKTGAVNNSSFLQNAPSELASSSLYMMEINDDNGDIYIATSDFTTNGTIYRFNRSGSFIEKFDAGGINPSHMVFIDK